MQKAKAGLLVLFLFVLVRFAGVYHRATEFNHYVQEQVSLIESKNSLKEVLLQKAEEKQIPITEQNINFTSSGSELRVSVDYHVPLNLLLFQKDLTFHSTGIHVN